MVPLFVLLSREAADTFSLVLSSAGIGNRVIRENNRYRIDVPESRVDAAINAVRRYQAENPAIEEDAPVSPQTHLPNNFSGIAVAVGLLIVHLSVMSSIAPEDYISVFGANARRILHGEAYRSATALVLHADAAHLAGNMVAIALFGSVVCAMTGTGVGWLMALACGIIGNLVNAVAHETGHISIGASTAVFGLVGIVCAIRAVNAMRSGRGWKAVLVAFGAGVALLAFLGAGARSDLGAHLFGFFSGLLMGGAYQLWVPSPAGRKGQVLCSVIAGSLLLAAWIQGAHT